MDKRKAALALAGVGAGLLARQLINRRSGAGFAGKTVLITGGSRGLGLAMAREFASQGARIAICARDEEELARARADLTRRGADVFSIPCDITDRPQVMRMIAAVLSRFGSLDVLVNNAGEIEVGPIDSMALEDFEHAMEVMFWGVVYPTMAALPYMKEKADARIVNITSIGGKVAVPHLLPYACAKFAAVGFSEGLRSELGRGGVRVVTIAPGLMRTGSYENAFFKGDKEKEATWFSLSSSMPGMSISAERAARQIVDATRKGEAEKILTTQANLLARFHGLFPGVTADVLGVVAKMLLPGPSDDQGKRRAKDLGVLKSPWMAGLTILGKAAARRFHQQPA